MAVSDIKVPLWNSSGHNKEYELIVSELAGRIGLTIKGKDDLEIYIQCYFNDLSRAWDAVK